MHSFWTFKKKLIDHIAFIYPIAFIDADFNIKNSWATAGKISGSDKLNITKDYL